MQDNEEKINYGGTAVQEEQPAEQTVAETPAEYTPEENSVTEAETASDVNEAVEGGSTQKNGKKKGGVDEELKNFDGRTIEAPKKSKFGWLGTVLLLVAIGLGIWAMFGIGTDMTDDPQNFAEVIRAGDWRFGIICVAVLLVILACDWMKYSVIMKTTTGKFNLRTSLKVQLLGKFYDNVTPFAAGGQPMQIYYLHKKGYSGGVSSAVVLIKYFTQMFTMCTISLIIMACNTHVIGMIQVNGAEWLRTLIPIAAWLGLAVNMFLPLMVIMFVIFPKFANKLASFVIGIGFKLKIVKDKDRTMEKAYKVVSDFRTAFKIMSHKPLNFIALVLLCVTEVCLRFAFPYFIMRAYSGLGASDGFIAVITVMALNVYATQCVTVVPTPGNSGAIESVGASAFTAVVAGSILSWSVFSWRFFVYYIYIIIGLGITVFEFIRKLVRQKRLKKESIQ